MKAPKKNLLAAAILAAPAFASALGLGGIEVRSGLNQPLVAEIPVTVNSPAERDSLSVNLASAEDFVRVGIDAGRNSVPIDFEVAKNSRGQTIIRVTSKESIREPFLQLLLEVNWNKGKLLREYSVLLDPPVTAPAVRQTAPAPVVAPSSTPELVREEVKTTPMATPADTAAVEEQPTETAVETAPIETKPTAADQPMVENKPVDDGPVATPMPAASDDRYTTKAGDTLYVIARNQANGASLDQMMVAILRLNPQAFQNGNMNLLKKGQILRMPGSEDLNKTSVAEARRVVREQNSLWRGYQAQASSTATSVADPGASGAMSTSRNTNTQPRMEVVAPRNEANGRALDSANSEIARLKEDLASRSNESAELKARIAELEKLKADQEKLLALKSDELAALQNKVSSAPAIPVETTPVETTPVETTPVETPPVETAPVDTTAVTSVDAGTPSTETTPADIWGDKGTESPATDTATEDPMAQSPDAEPTDGTSVTPMVDTPPAPVEPVTIEPTATVEPTPVEEKPWYLNPFVLGGAGLGLAGLLGWAFTRKKKPVVTMNGPSIADDMNFGIPSMGGAAVATGFDAGIDEDEARIRQAISGNPQDLWAHLDLLRLYYSRGDAGSFESAASTMYGYVMDQESPQWQEARSMGMQLTPQSSLFAPAPDFGSIGNLPDQFNSQFDLPPTAPPAATLRDDSIGSLDLSSFDDTPQPTKVMPVLGAAAATAAAAVASSDFSFDLSLDTPKAPAKTTALTPTAPPALVASAKDDFNFDFSFDQAATPVKMAETAPPSTAALDIEGIGMPDSAFSNAAGADADDFMIGDDAVGTKIDLARAYLDMGDPDGAKSMLDEVLAEGSEAQKRIAHELMARIS